MTKVECTVCGEMVGKMGIAKHSGMHKREFKEQFGRPPEDYDEVREKLNSEECGTTLSDFEGSS